MVDLSFVTFVTQVSLLPIHLFLFDVRESVHPDIIMKATKKMQLYRLVYYS
jgi:hypothetical protein